MTNDEAILKLAQEIGRRLAEEGKLVEAGWEMFCAMTMPPNVGEDQKWDMQMAFFAGAQHVFHTLLSIMDPGTEPTEADMLRIGNLDNELTRFAKFLAARYGITLPKVPQ
jgi:hypothetical protein